MKHNVLYIYLYLIIEEATFSLDFHLSDTVQCRCGVTN